MSYKHIDMWTVICDGCGASADDDTEYSAWAEKEHAQMSADDAWWLTVPGNKHHCEICRIDIEGEDDD
jgi:hypothetical protein